MDPLVIYPLAPSGIRGMLSPLVLVACNQIAYLHFCSSVHSVWLRCQTYFTTPSKIVWRISIGESCVGSNPNENVNRHCEHRTGQYLLGWISHSWWWPSFCLPSAEAHPEFSSDSCADFWALVLETTAVQSRIWFPRLSSGVRCAPCVNRKTMDQKQVMVPYIHLFLKHHTSNITLPTEVVPFSPNVPCYFTRHQVVRWVWI